MSPSDDRPGRRPPERRPPPRRPAPAPAPLTGTPDAIDLPLALKAGLNGLVFVAPAAIAGELLSDSDGDLRGGALVGVVAVQLLGFCFAGWVVRRLAPLSAMATCTLAGVACWAILQTAGIVTSLARGEDLAPLTWVATGLLASVAATAGGLLARVERVRPEPTGSRPTDPPEDP